jgi:hypothetical protein
VRAIASRMSNGAQCRIALEQGDDLLELGAMLIRLWSQVLTDRKSLLSLNLKFAILLAATAISMPSACLAKNENCLAKYLTGAQQQYENGQQRSEIKRALTEMLSMKPSALLKKRYCDYQMHPQQWTAVNILERYFVPDGRFVVDAKCFRASLNTKEAQEALKAQIKSIDAGAN